MSASQDPDPRSSRLPELVDHLETLRRRMTALQHALTEPPPPGVGTAGPDALREAPPSAAAIGHEPALRWSVRGTGDLASVAEPPGTRDAELMRVARFHAVGDVLGDLIHELNQPLAAIINYARGCELRLQTGELLPADLNDVVGRIAECAVAMGAQLRRMNELLQEGTGERIAMDLNAIVEELAAFANGHVRQQGFTLHLALAPRVPRVVVDRIQIRHVVLAALRMCIELGKAPRLSEIWLRTACHDGTVELIVSHSACTAPGLTELCPTAVPYGLQLELACARAIAEEHGALLDTHVIAGAGARFRLAFRVHEERP